MDWNEFNRMYLVDFSRSSAGGYAKVFRGIHRRLNMEVVFKQLKVQSTPNSMLHEVEVLKSVAHRCLPRVLDAVDVEGTFYSVIEYIPGPTLSEMIRDHGPVDRELLMKWSDDLCSALSALHNCTDPNGRPNPIIHADIKPDNLIIHSGDFRPVLIDFNISATTDSSALMGLSLAYSPPELVQAYYDAKNGIYNPSAPCYRTDLYSLGTVLYFAACAKKYTYENPDWEILRKKGYSQAFILWMQGLLNANPEARFQSVEDAWRALRKVRSVDEKSRQLKKSRPKKMGLYAVGMLCGALLINGGFYLQGKSRLSSFETVYADWNRQMNKGDYAEATAQARRLEEIDPESGTTWTCQAATRYQLGDYEGARTILTDNVINGNLDLSKADYGDALRLIARSAERMGDLDEAAKQYETMREKGIIEIRDIRDAAAVYAELDKGPKIDEWMGLDSAQNLISADLRFIEARSHRGGDDKKAKSLMLECLNGAADNDLLQRGGFYLAKWQIEDGSPALAVDTLDFIFSSISEIRAEPELYRLMAQAKMNLAAQSGSDFDLSSALAAIDVIVQEGWDTEDVWNAKAAFEAVLGKFDQARATVSRMEERFGASRVSAVRRALVEYEAVAGGKKADDYKVFVQYFQRAMDLEGDPENPDYVLLKKIGEQLKKEGLMK